MSDTSSTTPPLDGVDTSLTPEQRKAYEEIGAAMIGPHSGLPIHIRLGKGAWHTKDAKTQRCALAAMKKEQPK